MDQPARPRAGTCWLACGRCGRRLESAWPNGKPAYRCRHGHTSAASPDPASPDPARPKNAYVRENQILPHLAAMAILLAGNDMGRGERNGIMQLTTPSETAGLIDQLRTAGIILTYDPDTRTVRAGDSHPLAVTAATSR